MALLYFHNCPYSYALPQLGAFYLVSPQRMG